jgi:hypothetical protein
LVNQPLTDQRAKAVSAEEPRKVARPFAAVRPVLSNGPPSRAMRSGAAPGWNQGEFSRRTNKNLEAGA